jgi:hypothetical protein
MANNRFNKQATPKGYKAGGRIKKMGGGMMMQRPMYGKRWKNYGNCKSSSKKAKDKKASDRMKKKPNKKSGSSAADIFKSYGKYDGKPIELKDGGSLKAVPADNKGLKKLPTQVRNKMGFMKKGGVVSLRKNNLNFKANQAGQKATNKKAMKVAQDATGLNLVVGAAEVGKKIARKFKGE